MCAAFRASAVKDADVGGAEGTVHIAVGDGGGRCGAVAQDAAYLRAAGRHRCGHPAGVDAVRASQGRTHEAGAVIAAIYAARDLYVADGGTIDVAERSCVVGIWLVDVEVDGVSVAVEGAAERMVGCACHSGDRDVGTQHHVLPGKGFSAVHALGEGCPLGVVVDEKVGAVSPLDDIRLSGFNARGLREVQRQRAVGEVRAAERLHRGPFKRGAVEVTEGERQAQRIPLVTMAVKRVALKYHIVVLLPIGKGGDGLRVVGIFDQRFEIDGGKCNYIRPLRGVVVYY